ncbi:MAG: DUF3450 domain-containing protein [Oleiphilaceae bacterium]|nr:DUF3450 domain-containing protein [Oleiphilaceae bacterium]
MIKVTRSRPQWPGRLTLVTGLVVGLAFSATAPAQEPLEQVVEAGKSRLSNNSEMQNRIDALDDDIREKVKNYRSVTRDIEGLGVYLEQLQRQIRNQEKEMAQLSQSIEEAIVINRQVTPLMLEMVDGLEQFVALDLPFLEDKRRSSVAELKDTMDRADVSTAEKFRNVLQSYQEEIDYGRTIEAYRGKLDQSDEGREVDFLRIGRIALLYQTLDGTESGVWDSEANSWNPLPATYNNQVSQGLSIAREQAAPDLIRLPLNAPQEAGQ